MDIGTRTVNTFNRGRIEQTELDVGGRSFAFRHRKEGQFAALWHIVLRGSK